MELKNSYKNLLEISKFILFFTNNNIINTYTKLKGPSIRMKVFKLVEIQMS